ncbi:2-polyprenyl-6-methoxyphenol hydroxylase-like FAD-dependent oxidoreductase [Amycolatopsis bartoniae]|uniref:FAD-dependent oxidoreductase n=1 Tax=Amycolatopsis bartoniae TaxID=941986 RepID=A0A8H9IY70_9PSEU|nr:FAD-dependent monooxygenase [Amycolatopsis bartoniae]MBB2933015.1 2-polyprenyl-6-methoxyphenol hydroxylase-like FAD-dependent oxidoreductase [Amycolatopsis bartoniae]TVT03391.1 FAD-binding protein [Amycolatopsis bartoniae]GHF56398.1 FAD-dependent oxidoreductase [Amycolatopsis bartoniae]
MPEAVVVGGGIGGLTAAIALRRIGWSVEVLEQAAELKEVGAGLSLATNAMRALDELGIGDRVREHAAFSQVTGNQRLPSGRYLRRFREGRDVPLAAFHRAELHRVLLGELPGDVIRTGRRVTAVPYADLVVAADGVHSTFRNLLWDAPQPRRRYTAWRGVAEGVEVEGSFTLGRGRYFMIHPLPGGRACWALGSRADGPEAVRTWHEPIPELLAATETVLRNEILDLGPLPSYVHGNVVLLGDAAHAVTPDLGQGACQAIEDAVTLAAALRDEPVPAALARYDRERLPRTRMIAHTARRKGETAVSPNPLVHGLVALTTRWLPEAAVRRSTARVWDWSPPRLS